MKNCKCMHGNHCNITQQIIVYLFYIDILDTDNSVTFNCKTAIMFCKSIPQSLYRHELQIAQTLILFSGLYFLTIMVKNFYIVKHRRRLQLNFSDFFHWFSCCLWTSLLVRYWWILVNKDKCIPYLIFKLLIILWHLWLIFVTLWCIQYIKEHEWNEYKYICWSIKLVQRVDSHPCRWKVFIHFDNYELLQIILTSELLNL